MCIEILYKTLSESSLILRVTGQDMVKNVHWSSYKEPEILGRPE